MDTDQRASSTGPDISKARTVHVTVSTPTENGLDVPELSRALWAKRWLIIGVAALCAVAAVVYSLRLTPIYRAEAILAPVSKNDMGGFGSRLGGLASLAGFNLGSSGDGVQALAILESKNFAQEFIEENNLLPVLFADRWDSQNNRWMGENPDDWPDIRDGVHVFIKNIRFITEDSRTSLVTLAIEWKDPQVAADWAAELVSRINRRVRQREIEASEQKLSYLYEQLEKATIVELRQAIAGVIEEQINRMMLAQAQTDYAFTVVDPPVPPKQRVRPKRTLIVIIATVLGGFIAVFAVVMNYAIKKMVMNDHKRVV